MTRAEGGENTRRAGLALMPPLLTGLLCVAALIPRPLLAQTATAKAPLSSNRYLLVVETSRSTQRRADAILQVVQVLLKSGLAGQLRPGDTLGVWIYNESLYAGRFPLQTWSPEAEPGISQRTVAFLKEQTYEKQASFGKVLPGLSRLIKDSPLITIILISSADEEIHGTPFDVQINQFYQKWHDEQQKARMPFVTVLRAQDGQFTDFTVNTPPWQIQLPRLPQEVQSVEPVPTQLPKPVRTSPPPMAQPLILSGKKTPSPEARAPKPEPAGATVHAPAPTPEAPSTNKSLATKPLAPSVTPAQTVNPETAPVAPVKPAVAVLPTPSTALPPVPELKMEVAKSPETKQIASPSPASEPKPDVRESSGPAPLNVEASPALPPLEPKPVAEPATSLKASSDANATRPVPAAPPTVPAPPIQTATAAPAGTLVGWPIFWIVGLVLAGVAIGFVVLLRRRSHAAPGASLITQSFERKNKP